MVSSDMTHRLIQEIRPVQDDIPPRAREQPTGYLPGLPSPLSRGTSSEADDVGMKSSRFLACDFLRFRFSRNASFSRCWRVSLAAFSAGRPSPCLSSFIVDLFVCRTTTYPARFRRSGGQAPTKPIEASYRRKMRLFRLRPGLSRACALAGLVARIGRLVEPFLADSLIRGMLP
jgi:hypothetical protein